MFRFVFPISLLAACTAPLDAETDPLLETDTGWVNAPVHETPFTVRALDGEDYVLNAVPRVVLNGGIETVERSSTTPDHTVEIVVDGSGEIEPVSIGFTVGRSGDPTWLETVAEKRISVLYLYRRSAIRVTSETPLIGIINEYSVASWQFATAEEENSATIPNNELDVGSGLDLVIGLDWESDLPKGESFDLVVDFTWKSDEAPGVLFESTSNTCSWSIGDD